MWCNIKPSTDEETITSGFCTSGLFKITNNEIVTENPSLSCIVYKNRIVLGVENNLFIFQNDSITDCGFISFGSAIDTVVISQKGDLIVCGLRDGNIHGVSTDAIPVFHLLVENSNPSEFKTFVGIQQVNDDFYVLCTGGEFYRISNINETNLSNILSKTNDAYNETLLPNVTLEKLTKINTNFVLGTFYCVSSPMDESIEKSTIIAGGNNYLYFHSIGSKTTKVEIPKCFKEIKKIFAADNIILALSTTGILLEICPFSKLLLPFGSTDFLIEDATVIDENKNEIEFLFQTFPNEYGKKSLKIIEYPSMKCNFDLSVEETSWLIKQTKSSLDIYHLYGSRCDSDIVQEIVMKIISEARPLERFKKLLLRGLLEEAEQFALQHNLSLQPLYEAKTRILLINIGCFNQHDAPKLEEEFEKLLCLAKLIENSEFLLTLRNIDIANQTIMKRFLKFLIENVDFKNQMAEFYAIQEQLRRFETLKQIDPDNYYWQWQEFVNHTNFVTIVISALKQDIDIACIIWKRHLSSVIPNLMVTNITNILNSIPATTTSFNIVQFLKHFVPCILQTYPQTMSYLVDWSIQKAKSLQNSNHWPEFGLEFFNNIFAIFSDTNYIFSAPQHQFEVNISKLQLIINALQDLSILKKNYNLTFSLDDYINDSIEDTAFKILQRVNLKNLEKMVNDFLYPVLNEKGLTPANAIIKYVKFLVNNRKNVSVWQERAVAATELLHNEEDKLNCLLLVLKVAPVPWSDVLQPLLLYSSSNHPLASNIKAEYDLQKIKILKIKYGWQPNFIGNQLTLACRIVKINCPELIDDLKTLISSDPTKAVSIGFYGAYELSKRGDIEIALQFLNSLDEDHYQICCTKFINIVSTLMDFPYEYQTNIDNLVEFLKSAENKLNNKSKLCIQDICHLNILKNEFQIPDVSLSKLKNPQSKMEYLQNGIEKIVDNFSNSSDELITKVWSHLVNLSCALELDLIFTSIQLLKYVENINFSCSISNLILEIHSVSSSNAEFYIDLATLLVAQQMIHFEEHGGNHTNLFVYPLAYRLLQKCLNFSKIFYLEAHELLNWFKIGYNAYGIQTIEDYFSKEKHNLNSEVINKILQDIPVMKTMSKRHSMSVFDEVIEVNNMKPQNDPEAVIRCISLALKTLCSLSPNLIFDRLKTSVTKYFDLNKPDEIKMEFIPALDRLIKSKQYSASFTIVEYILKHQKSMSICIIPQQFTQALHRKILRFILHQKEPNFIDAQAVLLSSKSNAEYCINELGRDIKAEERINYLILQEVNNVFSENYQALCDSRESRMKCQYFTELCKIDPTLKNISTLEFVSMERLLNGLNNNILKVTFIEQLSKSFDWDYQEALITQIITILKSQKLDFDVKSDVFGKEEIVVKTSIESIIKICQPYLHEITNTALFVTKLQTFMDNINFYFYELYLCILEMINSVNAMPNDKKLWPNILWFLKHKMTMKRRNSIGQIETDWWLKMQLEAGVVRKIAKYRFPFKLIVEEGLNSILDEEVCIENCVQWFPLIKLYGALTGAESESHIIANQEYFCMTAVKNSISEYKNNERDSEKWNLYPKNNSFLQSILHLTKFISDPAKVLFILYFVANQAPDGADQVEAAYECYKFALEHKLELIGNKKASDIIDKIKRKYPIYKTQHLLHLYGLDDDKLFQYVENPVELINALYSHPLILNTQKPDINKVAYEIAILHDINFAEIQMAMLQKWLEFTKDSSYAELDETCYVDLNISVNNEDGDFISDSIIRAHYILSNWETEKAIQFLLSEFFLTNRPNNTGTQLQIFECFVKLIDENNVSYMQLLNQEQYITLKCIHCLKQFGFNMTPERFSDYDKVEILKKLWECHSTNAKALELIIYICVGYDIYLPQIWNGVLKQMVSLNMIKQLSSIVDILSTKQNLSNLDGLAFAWNYLIKAPFKKANKTKSFEQESQLSKSLFLLQSCPLIERIDLMDLALTCIQLDRSYMAAITIVFAENDEKYSIIELLNKHKSQTFKQDIIGLEEFGIYSFITKAAIKELNM